jgi:hypothetical protein
MAITDPTPHRNSTTAIHPETRAEDAFASVRLMVLVLVPLGDGLVLRRGNSLTAKIAVKVSMMLKGFTASARHLRNGYRDLA